MVYLYPHPYPVLPDTDDDAHRAESSSDARRRTTADPEERGAGEGRKKRRVTTEGTIGVLLPSLGVAVDVIAQQWGEGELPSPRRLGRDWWDDALVEAGDGKDAAADIEDGEIPESPTTPATTAKNPPSPTRNEGIPVLTRAHYHPKVIALAKKMAAARGVKLVVDPSAGRDVDTTQLKATTTEPGTKDTSKDTIKHVEGNPIGVKVEHSVESTPTPTDSGIFLPPPSSRSPGHSRTPGALADTTSERGSATPGFMDTPPPTSHLQSTSQHPLTPLGQGRRGRARGRGTGRWAGHWQAKAAAAAAREARAAQLARQRSSGLVLDVEEPPSSLGPGVREEGPEVERRRRREVAVALGSSSWW